jgi:hypothetical protein
MCGIIGQLAFGELSEEKEKTRRESMIFLGSELLQLTQVRGEDATGVSLLFEDGNYFGLKMGIAPIEFIARFGKSEKEYGGFIKAWRKTKRTAKVFMGHCRKASRGNTKDNNNNHPIRVGDIIGVHNGTLDNDDKIFAKLGCNRDGTVDSEAIMRLLHHYSNNGKEPFTIGMVKEVGQRLGGSYAVLAMSGNNPYQVCAFRDGRPIEMAFIKPLNMVIVASEKKFIETALFRYNKFGNLYMPEANLPVLKKDDVEYKLLQDDSGVVFDLTTKITAKTEIEDLYDWDKIPRTVVKGYEKGTTTSTYNKNSGTTGNRWNQAAGAAASKKEDNSVGSQSADKRSDKSDDKNKGKPGTGRVWSKKANKYVEKIADEEVEKTKTKGNVEIDVTSGKIEEVSDDDDGECPFALEHDKDAEGRTLSDPAKINEMDPPNCSDEDDDTIEVTAVEIEDEDGRTHTIEVDVEVDAEAIEKAEEMMKDEESFDKVEDVLEAFEIESEKTLGSLTPMALANRIRKFALRQGFIKGYMEGKKKKESSDGNKDAGPHIRRLKALFHMAEKINKFCGYKTRESAVERAVIEALESGVDLTKEGLDRVFTAGDDRNSDLIPLIKKMIADKQSR